MLASAVEKVEGGQMGVNDGDDRLIAPTPDGVDSRVRVGVEQPVVRPIMRICRMATG